MSLLEELLPLLDGVSKELFTKENIVLPPGESFEWRAESDGWISFCMGVCNQKHARIIHNIWVKEVSFSPFEAYTFGLTQENTTHIFCAKYDPANNIYALIYAPRPYKFFRKNDYIKIIAPKADPTTGEPITTPTIGSLYIELTYITDHKKFKESLREILGGATR